MKPPLITVHTPSYKRSAYLHRVWNGLKSQTYKNFEWIVSNDGGCEETNRLIIDFSKSSDFPITLVATDKRVGKSILDNNALEISRGDYFIWNDSDDYFLPEAFQLLMDAWEEIGDSDIDDHVAILALCEAVGGQINNDAVLVRAGPSIKWKDFDKVYNFNADGVLCFKSSILKKYKFKEVDFVIPENSVWVKMHEFKIKFIHKVIKIVEYKCENAISFSGKMEYSRGRAHSIIETRSVYGSKEFIKNIWEVITYVRYCLHGDISIFEAYEIRGMGISISEFIVASPIGLFLSIKDRLQGKVHKTHLEFLRNRERANLQIYLINSHSERNDW